MTTHRVRRTVRRSGNGSNVVADVNAVVSTGGSASSAMTTSITQDSERKTRRPDRAAGETTRGDH